MGNPFAGYSPGLEPRYGRFTSPDLLFVEVIDLRVIVDADAAVPRGDGVIGFAPSKIPRRPRSVASTHRTITAKNSSSEIADAKVNRRRRTASFYP
jgi:hypothetical protein